MIMVVVVHDNDVEVDVAADDADLIILVVVEHDVITHRAGWRREAVSRELSPGAHFANFAHFPHWLIGDWHPNPIPKITTDM